MSHPAQPVTERDAYGTTSVRSGDAAQFGDQRLKPDSLFHLLDCQFPSMVAVTRITMESD